ncbi:bifunctional aldolase/short-chain dehydrogenase [Rhodobacter capsulatus]|uniref:bifunctional aldolase/short-chain dehydrogenase n=1 Tax=Rhodobacter capsulatus TaxID=1061 RepID=UPI0006DCFE8A|nr:bifunctional aldolase/short-chain dehydrogenase [Rhodobacter capsulatus]KQB16508.1 short-chain dehydrogenase [Rhodobacter capsulatus]KQB17018.1 short-chain dehydrogenase [Rhodobacter capsulatus]PZX21881.1 rhamnose utilization protein RhaD (predicted bifunctional aldolase and dehydrogenase) [Rhodobacter capsulatus]QNR62481.1 bifunctional aldolase/short-chain dehydrogenase [Rhodobacter capsulatus]
MIRNLWNDEAAAAAGDDLGQRIYSARLIGAEPELVLHGGGNSSVKTEARDLFGETVSVLHVKGSGHDLATIDAAGMPAVRLEPMLRLAACDAVADEVLVKLQRLNLLDPAAPNPSVEMLLHAFLPHKFVDHTHATPFLVLANLPEAEAALRELFGERIALVPFVKPGFGLAKAGLATYEANPGVEALLLKNHGHFTWGPDAKSSYCRVIEHANLVEAWLADRRPAPLVPAAALPVAGIAPVLAGLRGALAAALPEEAALPVLDLRADDATRAFVSRPDLEALARAGVVTPDHVIRTKGEVLVLRKDAQTPEAMRAAVTDYVTRYRAYFDANKARFGGPVAMLNPMPGLIWLEGIGAIGAGADAKAARIAADIGSQSARVKADGPVAGGFRSISDADLFDMEYWPLELAKLGTAKAPALQGRVVLVTGGAGAIGLATAEAFAALGASIFIVDRPGEGLEKAVASLGRDHAGHGCDITQPGAAAAAVAACAARFGGLDILVSNAGAAITGDIATLDEQVLRGSFELNFFAHLAFSQAAIALYRAQAAGRGTRGAEPGQILFNVSKQAVNPGKGFAAYGLPKATSFFLLRQLALELGPEGIRVNGINADRIRSGLLTPEMIAARSSARGIDAGTYMAGNLLRAEVEARHVAEAFVALARAERTTAHVMTVDGGNIEAALR